MADIDRLMISPVGPIYTTADTAALLKVSVRTVQRLIRDRKLKSHKVGRVYRIAVSADRLYGCEQFMLQRLKEIRLQGS